MPIQPFYGHLGRLPYSCRGSSQPSDSAGTRPPGRATPASHSRGARGRRGVWRERCAAFAQDHASRRDASHSTAPTSPSTSAAMSSCSARSRLACHVSAGSAIRSSEPRSSSAICSTSRPCGPGCPATQVSCRRLGYRNTRAAAAGAEVTTSILCCGSTVQLVAGGETMAPTVRSHRKRPLNATLDSNCRTAIQGWLLLLRSFDIDGRKCALTCLGG
jgi:hypothetical protein